MIEHLVSRLRREYEAQGLIEDQMADNPFSEFKEWLGGVVEAGLAEPNTLLLATATPDGRPSARAVLMKDIDERGLVFYTGLESRKSIELRVNPRAAATFLWAPLHRQVRFEGSAHELSAEEADAYFAARPRGAQIGAHASHQSEPVASRKKLDSAYAELEEGFGHDPIPRPPWWGGWLLSIETAEFWQGQPNRLHDRVRYIQSGSEWKKERLAP